MGAEALYDRIQGLAPTTDSQRALQARALDMAVGISLTRWLM